MTEPVFELRDVSYHYPDGQVGLDGVNLTVSSSDRLAILGANGSGKSTLLQLLDGLVYCSAGEALAFGEVLSERSMEGTPFGRHFRQQVAFLFQNVDAQLFCSTVDDELAFGPRHLGMSEDEICRRTEDLVALFNLSEIRGRQPQHLSGGEKRRVGLASVLAVGPSVVLLDEPTSGLDPRNRAFLVDMLLGLSDAGRTVVIATHDLDLARDVTTKSVVISEDHCLAAAGETSSVLDDLDLLEKVNLIHVHEHSHGGVIHVHPHSHGGQHNHEHQEV